MSMAGHRLIIIQTPNKQLTIFIVIRSSIHMFRILLFALPFFGYYAHALRPCSGNLFWDPNLFACVSAPQCTLGPQWNGITIYPKADPATGYCVENCPAGTKWYDGPMPGQLDSPNIAVSKQCLGTCPVGTYGATDRCVMCGHGTWSNTLGATSHQQCNECPDGTTSWRGEATDPSQCAPCDPGTYADLNHWYCLLCHAGKFSNTAGATVCTACPAGKTSMLNSTSCH